MQSDQYSLAALVAIADLIPANTDLSINEMRTIVESSYSITLDKSSRGSRSVWNHIIAAAIRHKAMVKTRKLKQEPRRGINNKNKWQNVFVYRRTDNPIALPPNSMKEAMATLAKHRIDKAQAA